MHITRAPMRVQRRYTWLMLQTAPRPQLPSARSICFMILLLILGVLLHFGIRWRDPHGGSVQDEAAGGGRVLSGSGTIARCDRSGDAFGVGAGSDRRSWT